jgi:hypothetical protein
VDVVEDLSDEVRIGHVCNDSELSAAERAEGDVNIEDTLQAFGPRWLSISAGKFAEKNVSAPAAEIAKRRPTPLASARLRYLLTTPFDNPQTRAMCA